MHMYRSDLNITLLNALVSGTDCKIQTKALVRIKYFPPPVAKKNAFSSMFGQQFRRPRLTTLIFNNTNFRV